jgi:RHO1 GDP-GTP exchange protein 1/2
VQVIEDEDIRLLSSGPNTGKGDPVLVAMRGGYQDQCSVIEKIVELNETEEIVRTPQAEADRCAFCPILERKLAVRV